MKSEFVKAILLWLLFFAIQSPSFSQVGSVIKKVGKSVAKESIEKSTRTEVKNIGKDAMEHAVVKQAVKKNIREQMINRMEKEGIESFFEYGNKKVVNKISHTRFSPVKNRMNKSDYKIILSSSGNKNLSPTQKFKSEYLRSKLAKTQIKKELDVILAKDPIILDDKKLKDLLEHPEYLRAYIETYTGSRKNFQEFFIRLSMGDKEQVKKILSIPEIRRMINNSIRKANSSNGGFHEWLMTKNFEDFLTNGKWGEDGPFLALALTKLIQSTESVIFKYGGSHYLQVNSGRFHNGLAKVIEQCSSKEELFLAIKKYAKQNLTKESYRDFCKIFSEVFNTSDIIL